MKADEEITLFIHGFGSQGEGVGYFAKKAIFVDGALPGETVQARLIEERKTHGFAKLLKVIEPSPDRVSPPCPLFGVCGGCQLMHLSYLKQLEMKRERVLSAIQRIGKIDSCEVAPCIASPQPLGYRNKIQLPVREGPVLGLYAKSSHTIIEVDECLIHCGLGEKVLKQLKPLLAHISPYNPETGEGELRHVLIKSALYTQEVLVVFVTTNKAPSVALQEASFAILHTIPGVKGVVQNVQPSQGNTILGEVYCTLAGRSQIYETLCGLNFSISAASFFQVNPLQAEHLYQFALQSAEVKGHEVVVDAYCGVGTLALLFAKFVKKVIGIECVPQAIEDAKENAKRNEIQNSSFVCAKAEHYMQNFEKVDLLLLNPPRKGCDPSLFKSIERTHPLKIIYISCDPATLARDLSHLEKIGYKIDLIQPFDMFPQTSHVESIAKLTLSMR